VNSKSIRCAAVLVSLLASGVAQAHPGHAHDVLAGIAHPFMGLDHLLAMLTVGIWAAQLGGSARWLVPASFVGIMALTGGVGMLGIALPMVEGGIAASVLLLGLLVALSVRMSPAVGAVIVALFAAFHGNAHGLELPAAASWWQYAAGFILSTAVLHGAGLLVGGAMHKHRVWLRAVGVPVAACGAWMMAATS
jgi:urease accessory protein